MQGYAPDSGLPADRGPGTSGYSPGRGVLRAGGYRASAPRRRAGQGAWRHTTRRQRHALASAPARAVWQLLTGRRFEALAMPRIRPRALDTRVARGAGQGRASPERAAARPRTRLVAGKAAPAHCAPRAA